MKTPAQEIHEWIATEFKASSFDVCSRWAIEFRRMKIGVDNANRNKSAQDKSTESYSLKNYPYVREIMDSIARRNWIKKGAQTGLTEAAITIALFSNLRLGRDVIYYFPTKAKMTEFASSRVDDAIVLSPFIKSRCSINNSSLKRFSNATSLYMLGATPADLRSTAASRLIMDEFDEWFPAGVALALERLSGHDNTQAWGFSTPTLPDIGIDLKYSDSTRECYFFECPHCGKQIDLAWDEENKEFHCFEPGDKPSEAFYFCWRCRRPLPHEKKSQFLADGHYSAKTSEGDPVDPDPEVKRLNRGFYVPQMLSPTVTPEAFAIKLAAGLAGDIDALREFYNSGVAQPFLEDQHRVTDSHLRYAKLEAHTEHEKLHGGKPFRMTELGPITKKKHFVTLGIDQGGPVHHWVAVSWKFHRHIPGDPNDRAVGKMIGCGRIMVDEWEKIWGLMREYRVRQAVIDINPQPTDARKFARRYKEFVHLCLYTVGHTGREIILTEDDYGANLVKCDKTAWLSKTIGRIIAGNLLLPVDTPREFEEHLKSLIRTMHKDRVHAEFKKQDGVADHYAHALSYAEIALKVLDPPLTALETIVG